MTRQRLVGMATMLILAAAVVWLMLQPAVLSLAESKQDDMANMPAMGKKPAGEGREARDKGEDGSPGAMPGIVSISPERLQTIGVKYDQVARRPLEKVIRTVGRVAIDERKQAKVTTKFHG